MGKGSWYFHFQVHKKVYKKADSGNLAGHETKIFENSYLISDVEYNNHLLRSRKTWLKIYIKISTL